MVLYEVCVLECMYVGRAASPAAAIRSCGYGEKTNSTDSTSAPSLWRSEHITCSNSSYIIGPCWTPQDANLLCWWGFWGDGTRLLPSEHFCLTFGVQLGCET